MSSEHVSMDVNRHAFCALIAHVLCDTEADRQWALYYLRNYLGNKGTDLRSALFRMYPTETAEAAKWLAQERASTTPSYPIETEFEVRTYPSNGKRVAELNIKVHITDNKELQDVLKKLLASST